MIHLLDSLKGVKPLGYQQKISLNVVISKAVYTTMKPPESIEQLLRWKMASVPVNVLKRNLKQRTG